MFGPDKCGNDYKLHFIFRHVNPLNGTIEEKHAKKSKERIEEMFNDKKPHLYKLIVRPDNTYSISVDHKIVNEGSLLTDFTPAVNPPKEIDDPNDFKPETWDEREKVEKLMKFVKNAIYSKDLILKRFQIHRHRNLKIGTKMNHHKFQTLPPSSQTDGSIMKMK